MKQQRFSKALLTFFAVILALCTLCTVASAATEEVKNLGLAYGEIVPTNEKLGAQVKEYTFYGDSGNLYFMRISKGKPNAQFAVEIFSDSQYKNQIRSFKDEYSATPGNKPLSVTWNFKDLKSGTYYGKCYTIVTEGDKTIIDTSSLKTFTITINRLGKRTVELTKLETVANGMKITWKQVPTATKYNVYRRAAGQKYWTYLKTVGKDVTSYTDTGIKSGTYYAYTVKCSDGKNTSLYNKNGLFKYYLSQPALKAADGIYSAGYANIKWSAVPGASGYYIYRKGGSLSNYEWVNVATIKNGKTTSYIDRKANSSDWVYTYTVKAFFGKYASSYDSRGIDFDYIAAPKITAVAPRENGMSVSWQSTNSNIIKYNVYRKNGNAWKFIGSTTNKWFTDTTAESNKYYTYTVKGISKLNAGGFNQKGVTAKFLASPKLQPLTFDGKYQSIVKWNSVPGATGYKVYRKVNDSKGWYLCKTINKSTVTSFTDACKKGSGYKYTYTVRAFDSKGIHSWFYPNGTSSVVLAKPTFSVKQLDNTTKTFGNEIKWNAVTGATKYNVYRRIPGGKWEALIRGTKALTYADTKAQSGVKYDYAVRALNDSGSISYFYVKSSTAVAIPVITDVTIADAGVVINWKGTDKVTYTIYRAAHGTDKWEKVTTTDKLTYTDTFADTKLKGFNYAVTATINKVESVKSAVASNVTEISATAKFDEKTKSIKLEWTSPLAETVIISKVTNTEEPVELGAYTATLYKSFDDKSVEEGKKYTYTLTAQSKGKVNGTVTVTATYPYPPLDAVTITKISTDYNKGDSTCTLTWNPVKFATEYTVLRSSDKKEYKSVGTVKAADLKDGSFTFTNHITPELVYTYKITAKSNEDRKESTSAVTNDICVYAPLDAVRDLKASDAVKGDDGKIQVKISWAETKNAESYKVTRKGADGKWVDLVTFKVTPENKTLPTSYIDKTAEPNVKYTYAVEAISAKRGSVANTIEYTWNEK